VICDPNSLIDMGSEKATDQFFSCYELMIHLLFPKYVGMIRTCIELENTSSDT
jgi:hypothetical protein